ncbi:Glycosyltransferase, GT2 family [Quadrisphaera granulorum]|uniref:GT2 family glycosyltransferase n=1 Tax=Quadrisphaera granulorum TaxID=317664 RepID=A0A316AE39_9ACTN|nr:glycosyltransferase [Quadrisphaera granulorum]PWJ56045.1 GT2 family glycosyltransferase [Quadrisphaera granulorum]SZE94679.1 Glycosyltransferase, GT2 family [Quadrisphaera granulorum]
MAEPATGLGGARLGVVVVNYGDPAVLLHHALDEGRVAGWGGLGHVVVVDNPSQPQHRATLEEVCRRRGFDLVLMPTNGGFGAGANAGARRALDAGCDAVVVLNPDAQLEAPVLRELLADALAHPRALTTPRILREDGTSWFAGADLSLRDGTTRRAGRRSGPDLEPWLTAACLVVPADLWEELGGFDDDYFLYWEDIDLSHRCLVAGGELRLRDDLAVVHAVGGTQEGSGKSPVYLRHSCRNRLLFAAKHLPRRTALAWALGAPRYAVSVGLRGGARATLGRRGALRALVGGTASGLVCVARQSLR